MVPKVAANQSTCRSGWCASLCDCRCRSTEKGKVVHEGRDSEMVTEGAFILQGRLQVASVDDVQFVMSPVWRLSG